MLEIILEKIRNQNLPQLTLKQLNNFKATLNNKSKSKAGLNELIEWAENHSKIPDDLDEVFVAGFDYDLDKKDKLKHMRIVVTTKRLISLTQHSKFFCVIFKILLLVT